MNQTTMNVGFCAGVGATMALIAMGRGDMISRAAREPDKLMLTLVTLALFTTTPDTNEVLSAAVAKWVADCDAEDAKAATQ